MSGKKIFFTGSSSRVFGALTAFAGLLGVTATLVYTAVTGAPLSGQGTVQDRCMNASLGALAGGTTVVFGDVLWKESNQSP
jgi:hypothetical protein